MFFGNKYKSNRFITVYWRYIKARANIKRTSFFEERRLLSTKDVFLPKRRRYSMFVQSIKTCKVNLSMTGSGMTVKLRNSNMA